MSTPKFITLKPNPSLETEKAPFPSNPIPYREYVCLSISAFWINLTAPKKKVSKVGSK